MHIDYECSGGYANIRLEYHTNTDELPQEVANELLSLVETSYRLSLYEGTWKKSLYLNDVTAPATLQPLLARLQELAWEQRRKSR